MSNKRLRSNQLKVGKIYRLVGYVEETSSEQEMGSVFQVIEPTYQRSEWCGKVLYSPFDIKYGLKKESEWVTLDSDLYEELSEDEAVMYKLS